MALTIGIGAAVVTLAALTGSAQAQAQICTGTGFATAPSTTACDGSASPVTTTATVRNTASLTLQQIFGAPAGALTVAFGDVDAACQSSPGAGISCAPNAGAGTATWYGNLEFRVRLTGIGSATARLTGIRPAAGSIPAGQLLDGAAGAEPTTVYPVTPSTAASLQGGIGNGNTTVTRSFGLLVTSADAAASWTGQTSYSLVIE